MCETSRIRRGRMRIFWYTARLAASVCSVCSLCLAIAVSSRRRINDQSSCLQACHTPVARDARAAYAMTHGYGPACLWRANIQPVQMRPAEHLGAAGVVAVCIGRQQLLRQAFKLEQVDISDAVDHGQRMSLLHADHNAMATFRQTGPELQNIGSEGTTLRHAFP